MTCTALVTCSVMGYTAPYVWTLDPFLTPLSYLLELHMYNYYYYIDIDDQLPLQTWYYIIFFFCGITPLLNKGTLYYIVVP